VSNKDDDALTPTTAAPDRQTDAPSPPAPLTEGQGLCGEFPNKSAGSVSVCENDGRDTAATAELRTQGPDVAACIREARQQLEGQPAMNALGPGHRSVALQTALAPVRDAIEQRTLADMGFSPDGAETPPETVRSLARNFAALDVLAQTFWTWIEDRGVLTSKGKTRSAVTTYLGIIDRQSKLASVIGLQRRRRSAADMGIDEWLEHTRRSADDK
jgi:hypothetical protein